MTQYHDQRKKKLGREAEDLKFRLKKTDLSETVEACVDYWASVSIKNSGLERRARGTQTVGHAMSEGCRDMGAYESYGL